jgi:hypothetical protein
LPYSIEVKRDLKKGTGTVIYKSSAVSVNTKCWFELTNPIAAKTYTGCSATLMLTKKNSYGTSREGIYLPDKQTNRRGIFIHMGNNAAWSDGCIVIKEQEIQKIWNSIHPKDASNVTVTVKNT